MGRVNYSGLVIAGIGFFLTRFTVTLAVYQEPIRFYLAGILPLTLGLGLAAFGIALAVAEVDAALVRTTALWCVVGAVTMLVLVVLTLLGSSAGGMPDLGSVRSRTYLSNFLIGGSIGGTFTGLYAARTRRQRSQLHSQANRLEVLNRLLRHEVLNALTAIRGYASVQNADPQTARDVIERRSDSIEATIEEVKYLTQSTGRTHTSANPIDLKSALEGSVAAVRDAYPDASITVDGPESSVQVVANERLQRVFTHLIENAVVHTETDEPAVTIHTDVGPRSVSVSIEDEGPGLPPAERQLLETGEIEEYDNPDTGFGLNVVRLLLESCDASVGVSTDAEGTNVTVTLQRLSSTESTFRPSPTSLTGVRPAVPHLIVTLGASLIAGVAYGIAAGFLGGSIGIIGVLYGVQSPVVGWIAHEFHSVVFGFVFAGLVSLAPANYHDSLPIHAAIGVGWGLVLWLFAAGVISPIWLGLLGFPVQIPSLSSVTFVGHIAWGLSLGLLTALGYRHLAPRLSAWGTRLRSVWAKPAP